MIIHMKKASQGIFMKPKLLIINCPSEYFVHIPMGTFGLCDYLSRKDIHGKMLNLALYDKTEAINILDKYMNILQPTHIGLVFHWQATAEGFIRVGEYIKSRNEHVKIFCGGFTAGYFGKNLIERCGFLDFIIKGDPEKPVELLLGGAEYTEIPNLIYRDSAGILSNEVSYFIDKETLSNISFCNITYLYEHELYIKAVEEKLGFPVFIGRGCVFNCRYCGGSSDSFRLHSERGRPVGRTTDAVIEDLKQIKDFTRKIYICYENKQSYIKTLLKAIKKEKDLCKTFHLNYGAWKLFDKEFLELYKDIFILDQRKKPIFEISPEVYDDKFRKKTKSQRATYSIKDLKQNLFIINDYIGDSINVSVFFSRYHDTAKTYLEMRKEIVGIFRFIHELFSSNITNTKILYDHLSTDVASRYWESYVEHPRDFDTLISAARKLKSHEIYSFPVNNLCVYIPETFSEKDIFKCELLIFILKTLETHFNELFHILFKCLDEHAIALIEEIIEEEYANRPWNKFTDIDFCELLNQIKIKISQQETLLYRIPFIEDLTGLFIKKALYRVRPQQLKTLYQT